MKLKFFFLIVLLTLMGCNGNTNTSKNNPEVNASKNEVNKLRHVVLFKFKESATSKDIQNIEQAFRNLKIKIPEIIDFEWGTNNSPEKLNKGFTHCFFLTFNSENDRDVYLSHSAHLAFGDVLSPHLEDVLVVDYWSK